MKNIILIIVILGLILGIILALGSCMSDVTSIDATPTPTAEGLHPAVEVFVDIQKAEATSNAIQATQFVLYGVQTATAKVEHERATSQAAEATAQEERRKEAATAQQERRKEAATAQAFSIAMTATQSVFLQYQAATAKAWEVTGTAAAMGTATAYPMTATAQADYATATERAWKSTATMDAALGSAASTAAAGEAESVVLAVARERTTIMIRAFTPWAVLVALVMVIFMVMVRYSRLRVVARDAFGAAPLLVMSNRDIVDADTVTTITLGDGIPTVNESNPIRAARQQKINMVRALPAERPSQAGMSILNLPEDREDYPIIQSVPPETMREILEDVTDQVIAEDD